MYKNKVKSINENDFCHLVHTCSSIHEISKAIGVNGIRGIKTRLSSYQEDELMGLIEFCEVRDRYFKMRDQLITSGIPEQCGHCSQGPIHMGSLLPLYITHINGDHTDNSTTNLQIACPNCHSGICGVRCLISNIH